MLHQTQQRYLTALRKFNGFVAINIILMILNLLGIAEILMVVRRLIVMIIFNFLHGLEKTVRLSCYSHLWLLMNLIR